MSRVDELRDSGAEADLPVYLALGVLSALQRLEPWLPEPAPSSEPAPPPPPPPTAPSARLLYLALGLVSFRRKWTAALESLVPPPAAASAPGPAPTPRELLR